MTAEREQAPSLQKDADPRAKPSIVCILGMHRSGTSVATRLLNLLGVDLGPESHLVKPTADNPKGFWEHRKIVRLNDKLLARLGGTSYNVPSRLTDMAYAPELNGLRRRAEAIITEDFASAPRWGWKDPRTCVTLPFWRQLLPPMRYVLCFRNPAEVAGSLERRDGLSPAKSLHLWLLYSLLALKETRTSSRTFVFYEDLMDNWRRELRALASFLGEPERADDPEVFRVAEGFVDDTLRHHHSTVRLAADAPDIARGLVGRALLLAQQAYTHLREDGPSGTVAEQAIRDAITILDADVHREADATARRWQEKVALTLRELSAAIPDGSAFTLVDGNQLGVGADLGGRPRYPFVERDGRDFGRPTDAQNAVRELHRLRQSTARYIAFAWPAFWWLDHYDALHVELRATASCILSNDRIIVFDLRPETR